MLRQLTADRCAMRLSTTLYSVLRLVVNLTCKRLYETSHSPNPTAATTFKHVQALCSNVRHFEAPAPPTPSRLPALRATATYLHSLVVRAAQTLPPSSPAVALVAERLSELELIGLLMREECNSFGVWHASAVDIGLCLLPLASYFNHSCVPCVGYVRRHRAYAFYALRDIEQGQALAISYVDLRLRRAVRRQLLATYFHFDCDCQRCLAVAKAQAVAPSSSAASAGASVKTGSHDSAGLSLEAECKADPLLSTTHAMCGACGELPAVWLCASTCATSSPASKDGRRCTMCGAAPSFSVHNGNNKHKLTLTTDPSYSLSFLDELLTPDQQRAAFTPPDSTALSAAASSPVAIIAALAAVTLCAWLWALHTNTRNSTAS